MSHQPMDSRRSTQVGRCRDRVVGVAFIVSLIACVLTDPGPAGRIPGRIPTLVRANAAKTANTPNI
jgi:hypothetical protein